jgi:DNA polymerase-3 subunit alpha
LIEKHLGVTHGIMVYQEQAMFLVREMAGLDWIEIDKFRKAISKKQGDAFEQSCNLFKTRALARGISESVVNEVLKLMEKFGGYAFNRSHSCAYAVLSYWTAWLRKYYPSEWFAACIQVDHDDEVKMAMYKSECRNEGIKILNPNVNDSGFETTVTESKAIALPLTTLKGVGELAKTIVVNQPFSSLRDLVERAKPNRGLVQSLADGGALSCFSELNRMDQDDIMNYYDALVDERNKRIKQAEKEAKQGYKVLSPLMARKQKKELDLHQSKKKTIPPFNKGLRDE